MAQKIFPRSLRSTKLLSQDYSFYSEKLYPTVWANGYKLSNALFSFSQKNLLEKIKPKNKNNKRPKKKKKSPSFLGTRSYCSNWMGTFQYSPILFKFQRHSLSKKYNPIKTARKPRLLVNKFKKSLLNKKKKNSIV